MERDRYASASRRQHQVAVAGADAVGIRSCRSAAAVRSLPCRRLNPGADNRSLVTLQGGCAVECHGLGLPSPRVPRGRVRSETGYAILAAAALVHSSRRDRGAHDGQPTVAGAGVERGGARSLGGATADGAGVGAAGADSCRPVPARAARGWSQSTWARMPTRCGNGVTALPRIGWRACATSRTPESLLPDGMHWNSRGRGSCAALLSGGSGQGPMAKASSLPVGTVQRIW